MCTRLQQEGLAEIESARKPRVPRVGRIPATGVMYAMVYGPFHRVGVDDLQPNRGSRKSWKGSREKKRRGRPGIC